MTAVVVKSSENTYLKWRARMQMYRVLPRSKFHVYMLV